MRHERHSTPSASPRPVRARARPRRASRSCGPLPGAACGCRGSNAGRTTSILTFHAQATGRPACNLDTWMMGRDGVRALWDSRAHDADARRLRRASWGFSTAVIPAFRREARPIAPAPSAFPIVLVFNGRGMAGSVAALVAGFQLHAVAHGRPASSEPLPIMWEAPVMRTYYARHWNAPTFRRCSARCPVVRNGGCPNASSGSSPRKRPGPPPHGSTR